MVEESPRIYGGLGSPLAESLLPETLGQNQRLERIDDAVDWERLGLLVAEVCSAHENRRRSLLLSDCDEYRDNNTYPFECTQPAE